MYLLFQYDDYYPAGGMGDFVAIIQAGNDEDAERFATARLDEHRCDNMELVHIAGGDWRVVASD